jgi:hypothetical protein
MAGLDVSPIGV